MFYGRVIVALIYVDDVILFGTNQDNINEVIKELYDDGIFLTVDDNVYTLLGVGVKTYNRA